MLFSNIICSGNKKACNFWLGLNLNLIFFLVEKIFVSGTSSNKNFKNIFLAKRYGLGCLTLKKAVFVVFYVFQSQSVINYKVLFNPQHLWIHLFLWLKDWKPFFRVFFKTIFKKFNHSFIELHVQRIPSRARWHKREGWHKRTRWYEREGWRKWAWWMWWSTR